MGSMLQKLGFMPSRKCFENRSYQSFGNISFLQRTSFFPFISKTPLVGIIVGKVVCLVHVLLKILTKITVQSKQCFFLIFLPLWSTFLFYLSRADWIFVRENKTDSIFSSLLATFFYLLFFWVLPFLFGLMPDWVSLLLLPLGR